MSFGIRRSHFWEFMYVHRQLVCAQSGGRERRLAGLGMATYSQARLSLSWMEASPDASDATASAAGHGMHDASRAVRHQTALCRQNTFISI